MTGLNHNLVSLYLLILENSNILTISSFFGNFLFFFFFGKINLKKNFLLGFFRFWKVGEKAKLTRLEWNGKDREKKMGVSFCCFHLFVVKEYPLFL